MRGSQAPDIVSARPGPLRQALRSPPGAQRSDDSLDEIDKIAKRPSTVRDINGEAEKPALLAMIIDGPLSDRPDLQPLSRLQLIGFAR